MQKLLALLRWLWNGLKGLAAIVFPMFAGVRTPRGPGPRTRRVLHVLLLAALLVALWVANVMLGLDRYLRVPLAPLSGLREVWLPILFLLFYSLCWLGWFLWRLLGPDQELSEFPDIDLAWAEAMRALEQASIDPTETPLFLLLGRPAAGEKALFQASQLPFQVRQAPRRIDAPLYVYADRDAIYLSCAGASLLGRQAAILAGEAVGDLEGIVPESEAEPAEEMSTLISAATLVRPDLHSDVTEGLSPVTATETMVDFEISGLESAFAEPAPITATTESVIMSEAQAAAAAERARVFRPRRSLLKNADEVERLTARLRHLCLLIARERRPYCPINGILLMVPLAATDDETDTKDTASLCQRDLSTARAALRVHCPLFVVLCDLERTPGYGEFIRHFPEEQRRRLLGQPFPLVPDLDATAKLRKIEQGVQWIGNVLIPSLVYKLWRIEASNRGDAGAVTAANIRLFRFLAEIRDRQRRFSRIVTRGIVLHSQGPLMLGGCYLAGTGRDSSREQGFIAGIFRQLVENQNFVAWTPEALDEEADYRRWTFYGYLGLALIVVLLALVLVSLVWPFR